MPQSERRLPPGSWVLVTGANGYIASHIVDLLLEEGYNVRGTVRAPREWLGKYFNDKYGAGRFETATVAKLDDEEALKAAVDGVAGVVHVASDLSFTSDAGTIISNVIRMTQTFLQAAANQPSVKSVVLTSSSSAALDPQPNVKGIVVTEETWNDPAVEAAWKGELPADQLAWKVYAASKTEGERAFWKWIKDNQPSFAANTVLPNMATGTILIPEIAGSTMGWTRELLKGEDQKTVGAIPPQYYIDVHDIARVHVAALLDPNVQNQRLFAFAHTFNWTDIIGIFHKLRPENTKLPSPPEDEPRDYSDLSGPIAKAQKLIEDFFGVKGWVSLEDSLRDGIAGYDE